MWTDVQENDRCDSYVVDSCARFERRFSTVFHKKSTHFRGAESNRFAPRFAVERLSTTRDYPHRHVDTLLIAPQLQLLGATHIGRAYAPTLEWCPDLRAREHPGSFALRGAGQRASQFPPIAQNRSVTNPLRARMPEGR